MDVGFGPEPEPGFVPCAKLPAGSASSIARRKSKSFILALDSVSMLGLKLG